jgi:hypothetical protein
LHPVAGDDVIVSQSRQRSAAALQNGDQGTRGINAIERLALLCR